MCLTAQTVAATKPRQGQPKKSNSGLFFTDVQDEIAYMNMCRQLCSAVFTLSLTLFVGTSFADGDPDEDEADVAPGYVDLRSAKDARYQQAFDASLKKLALEGAVQSGRLAATLVDITDPMHPRLAQVNGDRMMYAASLPKIAILLGAFEKAAEQKLTMDAAALAELTAMIRHSSNTAASNMLQRVGMDYLAKVLRSDRYRLYDTSLNGGLWVGKPYGAGAAGQRDPLHNLSHGATAYQVARFYYLLETGQLVSPQASRQMKQILSAPGIHHKFVKGLEQTHPDSQLYRKSGTWRTFHADSAIVERSGRRYIAVGIAEDPKGGDWMRELIVAMDNIVFDKKLAAPAMVTMATTTRLAK